MSSSRRLPAHSVLWPVIVATVGIVVCSLPVYLTGVLGPRLGSDLAFGVARLGLAVAIFRATGVATSMVAGKLVDRIGAFLSLQIAGGLAAVSCAGIALLATSWTGLAGFLIFGGLGLSLAEPAGSRLIAFGVRAGRQGIAFGVKQSAQPIASMLAAFLASLVVGLPWRLAFTLPLIVAVLGISLGWGRNGSIVVDSSSGRAPAPVSSITMAWLAAGFGLATFANASVPVYFVAASIDSGATPSSAGAMLGFASFLAVSTRIGLGVASDRMRAGHLLLCASLVLFGGIGLLLLSTGEPMAMSFGVCVSLVGVWGFNGVFWYAVVREFPESPGAVSGMVAPGGMLGGIAGPVIVGLTIERFSYEYGWILSSLFACLATMTMAYSSRRMRRRQP